jgi:hypothetical protein
MPIFDEADRGRHREDDELLRSGHVHLYRHEWARDRLINDLRALGYADFAVDLTGRTDADGKR